MSDEDPDRRQRRKTVQARRLRVPVDEVPRQRAISSEATLDDADLEEMEVEAQQPPAPPAPPAPEYAAPPAVEFAALPAPEYAAPPAPEYAAPSAEPYPSQAPAGEEPPPVVAPWPALGSPSAPEPPPAINPAQRLGSSVVIQRSMVILGSVPAPSSPVAVAATPALVPSRLPSFDTYELEELPPLDVEATVPGVSLSTLTGREAPMEARPEAPFDEPPAAPLFDAPAAPLFDAPAAPLFDAPAAPLFDAPAAPLFDAPAAPLFDAPLAPVFDAPPAAFFDAPPAPQLDAPPEPSVEVHFAEETSTELTIEEAPDSDDFAGLDDFDDGAAPDGAADDDLLLAEPTRVVGAGAQPAVDEVALPEALGSSAAEPLAPSAAAAPRPRLERPVGFARPLTQPPPDFVQASSPTPPSVARAPSQPPPELQRSASQPPPPVARPASQYSFTRPLSQPPAALARALSERPSPVAASAADSTSELGVGVDVTFEEFDVPASPADDLEPAPTLVVQPSVPPESAPPEDLATEELAAEDVAAAEASPVTRPVPPPAPPVAGARPPPAPPAAPRVAPPAAAVAPPPPAAAAPVADAPAALDTPEQPKRKKRAKVWWEEFFNDDYLRTVRPPKQEQVVRQCNFLEYSLGLRKGATILDVGCGLGLQAVELASRGYLVVGLDLSLPMLSRAADEAQDREIKMNFLHGDMREMSFDGAFDAVLCLGTTFGYFDDDANRQVLERMKRALKPQGLLLLDLVNRDFVVQGQPNVVWFEGDGCICMEETQFNYITSRLHVKRTVILEDGRQRENEYAIRLYPLHEVGQLMHQMGFRVAEVSGMEATPGVYFGATSPRLILLAERRVERATGPMTVPGAGATPPPAPPGEVAAAPPPDGDGSGSPSG